MYEWTDKSPNFRHYLTCHNSWWKTEWEKGEEGYLKGRERGKMREKERQWHAKIWWSRITQNHMTEREKTPWPPLRVTVRYKPVPIGWSSRMNPNLRSFFVPVRSYDVEFRVLLLFWGLFLFLPSFWHSLCKWSWVLLFGHLIFPYVE